MMLAQVPKTMTGPAIMNILAAVPVMKPSLLNSRAGETTAFAKPVMGTRVPGSAELRSVVIDARGRCRAREEHQRHRAGRARVRAREARHDPELGYHLAERADGPADEKGAQQVAPERRGGGLALYVFRVLLVRHIRHKINSRAYFAANEPDYFTL